GGDDDARHRVLAEEGLAAGARGGGDMGDGGAAHRHRRLRGPRSSSSRRSNTPPRCPPTAAPTAANTMPSRNPTTPPAAVAMARSNPAKTPIFRYSTSDPSHRGRVGGAGCGRTGGD